ncbi:ORF4b [Kibale red-tailed guenon virus 1]|uniref:ORF4b n=1 Tax=Kibale red-tailed guenon virus 1 TaxID=1965065 RepID=L0CS32_9NIDO|nr:ORF4b [Kibale red-tailed guenon virus 1]AGA19107.1 ORF4b [Kibale red-tailed guenon virus 1]
MPFTSYSPQSLTSLSTFSSSLLRSLLVSSLVWSFVRPSPAAQESLQGVPSRLALLRQCRGNTELYHSYFTATAQIDSDSLARYVYDLALRPILIRHYSINICRFRPIQFAHNHTFSLRHLASLKHCEDVSELVHILETNTTWQLPLWALGLSHSPSFSMCYLSTALIITLQLKYACQRALARLVSTCRSR